MITLVDIYKAVKHTIENSLVDTDFSNVPIVAEDTEEIKRPSLKISMDGNKTEKFNNNKERTLTVRVYFYAKDRYKYRIDNLKMQDILENVFLEDVKVTDTFYMPILEDGIESSVIDGVLECSFDLYSVEEIEDTTECETLDELIQNFEYEE